MHAIEDKRKNKKKNSVPKTIYCVSREKIKIKKSVNPKHKENKNFNIMKWLTNSKLGKNLH